MAHIQPMALPESEPIKQKEPAESRSQENFPRTKTIEKPEIQEKEFTKIEPEIILAPEAIVSPPAVKKESNDSPISSPAPKIIKKGIVKGFRLAQFGMSEQQIIQAIEVDFGLAEKKS